jgi:hypothetical protein
MLRINNDAVIVRLPRSPARMLTGLYAIQSGRNLFDARWSRAQIDAICSQQHDAPVSMVRMDGRVLWYFMGSFYWDDEGLREEDVRALVAGRYRHRDWKVPTAHGLIRDEAAGGPRPEDSADDLERAVDARGGGRSPVRVNVWS